MTMRGLIVAMGMAAAAIAGPVLAHDTDAPRAGRGGDRGMAERMGKRLELTADQQAKIRQLNEAHGAAMKAKHEAQRALVKDLRELVKSKAADGALTAKLDALTAGHRAIEASEQAHRDAIAAILTPMQKAKFVLWLAHKMERGGHWKQGKDGNGGKDMKGKAEGHDEHGDGDDDDD